MAENQNFPITFSKTLPYRIPAKSVKLFMGHCKSTFMAISKLGFIMNKLGRHLELPNDFSGILPPACLLVY
jgi:hypothetical protein